MIPLLQGQTVVAAELLLEDKSAWTVTCVSMGNPHAIVCATRDGKQFEVRCQHLCRLVPAHNRVEAICMSGVQPADGC